MSWFDTKNFANLAKTAITAAQKKIDNVLDIQEDEHNAAAGATIALANNSGSAGVGSSSAGVGVSSVAGEKSLRRKLPGGASKTEPSTPVSSGGGGADVKVLLDGTAAASTSVTPTMANIASTWGSFTGSFFENPNANEMITTPPKASGTSATAAASSDVSAIVTTGNGGGGGGGPKRQSVTSNSDSVELLSSTATSPSSELATPSEVAAVSTSTSVDLLNTPTPTASDATHALDSSMSLPDSIVIIGSSNDAIDDEEEEDSVSFNTVMDDNDGTLTAVDQTISCEESKQLELCTTGSSTPLTQRSSTESMKRPISLKDMSYESSQTVDSDSTQSFEDIQMQTSSSQCSSGQTPSNFTATSETSAASEDKLDDRCDKLHSPPNSNDEMETATSSDIEIISNPNGDSSSTHSLTTRMSPQQKKASGGGGSSGACGGGGGGNGATAGHSPSTHHANPMPSAAKAPKKGHCREPSEISILSEDSQSELDKLMQRISELNGILETRELRLLESERQNALLHERSAELQTALDALRGNSSASLESSEEYTARLSALEKKFQASIRERDALRIQIKALKDELHDKIPKDELVHVVAEKDGMVEELRHEGEKLAKEVLQQSNILKKLRLKEKTSDGVLKKNKEQIATLNDETERLKKSLHAKEELERTQIEMINKISSEKRKLDEEQAQLRGKLEDVQTKLSTMQTNFEAVKVELQQRVRLHTDLTRSAEEAQHVKREREQMRAENAEMLVQLAELREKLRGYELVAVKREQQLRDENRALLQRVEAAELRAECAAQEMSVTTVPLMRQLDALQSTLTQRTSNWQAEEKALLMKLDAAQSRLKTLEHAKDSYTEKVDMLQARCMELEEKLADALMQREQAKLTLQQAQLDYNLQEVDFKRQIGTLNESLNECNAQLCALQADKQCLAEQLRDNSSDHHHHNNRSSAKTQTTAEDCEATPTRLSRAALHEFTTSTAMSEQQQQQQSQQQQQQTGQQQQQQQQQPSSQQQQRSTSPALSYDVNSLEEAMGGSVDWAAADDLECISNSGRPFGGMPSLHFMSHNTTTLEHLQALLKQRDGELSHLQWELSRLQAERSLVSEEMSHLTLELENAKDKLLTYETLEKSFDDLQQRYDALLQMYGEKVERTEELELDLYELKEAYKVQIDELLAQPR